MAAITSTDNKGRLDYLAQIVAEQFEIDLQWAFMLSGVTLIYDENGDIEIIILAHDLQRMICYINSLL